MLSKDGIRRYAAALIELGVIEDLSVKGDVTTDLLPADIKLKGQVVAKKPGVVCGITLMQAVFSQLAQAARFKPLVEDGDRVKAGQAVALVEGPREVLTAERLALNFLQRLSGIATLTRQYADELKGTRAKLFDTRKTTPAWRDLEKYAVRCGGGHNHRMSLSDAVMIKDNHLSYLKKTAPAVLKAKLPHGLPLIIEAKDREEIDWAIDAGATVLLLDNMTPARLKKEMAYIRSRSPKTEIEVSGGVALQDIRKIARLGPDRISVGRLTHSAPALDFSLEIL